MIIERIPSKNIEPLSFERPSSQAYWYIKGWKVETPFEARQVQNLTVVTQPVDAHSIEQVARDLVCCFRESYLADNRSAREDIHVFKSLNRRARRRSADMHDACYRLFEGIAAKREKIRCQKDIIAHLEEAANSGDESAFVSKLRIVRWEGRPASDFVYVVKLALKVGAHLVAREIADEAVKHYPHDPEVQKHARLLAPPKVISSNLPPDPSQKLNRDWLKAHRSDYPNKWVAIKNGKLLRIADSLKELTERVNEEDVLFAKA